MSLDFTSGFGDDPDEDLLSTSLYYMDEEYQVIKFIRDENFSTSLSKVFSPEFEIIQVKNVFVKNFLGLAIRKDQTYIKIFSLHTPQKSIASLENNDGKSLDDFAHEICKKLITLFY